MTADEVAAALAGEYARITGNVTTDFATLRLPGYGDTAHPEMDLDSLAFLELVAAVEEMLEVEFADQLVYDGMRSGGDLIFAITAAVRQTS